MSSNTHTSAIYLHETFKGLGPCARLPCAERQGNLNACPCYLIAKFFLDHLSGLFHHLLSETQCHEFLPAIAGEWTSPSDSALHTFNTSTGDVLFSSDMETSGFSGSPPMEFDSIHQPLSDIPLDLDNGMDARCLSDPVYSEGCNFNLEHLPEFKSSDSFPSELSPMDYPSLQTWNPYPFPSPDASDESLFSDHSWMNDYAHDNLTDPLLHNTQPLTQNSSCLSSWCGGLDLYSPTSSWSEERERNCERLVDNTDSTSSLCRWDDGGGVSCSSRLTFDKSEVGKHLQLKHGVKSGGDKEKTTCNWVGCGKEMNKESISRHIVAVHLSNKPEYCNCGKQFARLDSKLRHLKNSKRGECRESEDHDSSRAKRRRLSSP